MFLRKDIWRSWKSICDLISHITNNRRQYFYLIIEYYGEVKDKVFGKMTYLSNIFLRFYLETKAHTDNTYIITQY